MYDSGACKYTFPDELRLHVASANDFFFQCSAQCWNHRRLNTHAKATFAKDQQVHEQQPVQSIP